ncbi:MAG: hypothetical protein K2Y27_27385, partial [Xanthobacteraceae bacterium]|nr:hypothetical protein [Xanthobacteraceae bacterium]
MRSSNRRFRLIGVLSISTALAVVAVAAATSASHAQYRPSGMSMGPRGGSMGNMGGGSMMGGHGFRNSEPRFQRFQNSIQDNPKLGHPKLGSRYPGKGKGKGSDVVVIRDPGGDGRPPHRPPHRPPGKRPPWVGPGIGPIVGPPVVGIAVATPGPVGAGPAGMGPLRPPSRGTTVAQRGGVTLPQPSDPRFVKNEVLIEVVGQISPQESNAIAARNRLTRVESFYSPLTNSTMFL